MEKEAGRVGAWRKEKRNKRRWKSGETSAGKT
jgi:hypothetical protein